MAAKWTMAGAVLVLLASVLSAACDPTSGGSTCFPADHGPSDTSCAGFDVTLICPVGVTPSYSCTCTATGTTQSWVCGPVDGAGGGGGGGGSTTGTGGATSSTTGAASTTSSSGGTGGAGADGGP